MKEAINQRFIEAVNTIISNNKEYNKKIIASKLEIKPSTFSEILNKRMNISIDALLLFSEIFNVSIEWILLGKGSMFSNSVHQDNTLSEPSSIYDSSSEILKEKMAFLIEQIEFYKTKSEFLAYQLKAKKIPEGKELEEGMRIIDKIEEALSKKYI